MAGSSATNPASANHQLRRFAPNRANGARLGFSRTKTDGQYQSVPSASAATHQITGLPVQVLSRVVGQATQRARSGQTSGRGRRRQTAHAVAPSGIAHQRATRAPPAATANGTNSTKPDRGIQHVAGPDLVRPGELVRLEVRAAGQPAGGDVAVEEEVNPEGLLERIGNQHHERERNREDRHRQRDGGPARMRQADPHRPIVAGCASAGSGVRSPPLPQSGLDLE